MKAIPLLVCLLFASLSCQAQIAFFDFNNHSLASTDSDPRSVVSDITTPLPTMFSNSSFCAGPAWLSHTPQGPFNSSPAYLEFTVTPAVAQSYTSLKIRTWRDGGDTDYIEFAGLYADEDPGPGGDNFATLLDSGDIFPQSSGAGSETLHFAGVSFLQDLATPVTFRLYLWGNSDSCCSAAEILGIKLRGECSGIEAEVTPLGPSCNLPLDPVLEADLPILGQTSRIFMDTAFPGALVFPFASIGPVAPVTIATTPPCTIYVDFMDPTNIIWLPTSFIDANGHWEMPLPLPADPILMGMEAIVQVRVCAPNGPVGPLFPDWSSSGLMLRLGCPPSNGN